MSCGFIPETLSPDPPSQSRNTGAGLSIFCDLYITVEMNPGHLLLKSHTLKVSVVTFGEPSYMGRFETDPVTDHLIPTLEPPPINIALSPTMNRLLCYLLSSRGEGPSATSKDSPSKSSCRSRATSRPACATSTLYYVPTGSYTVFSRPSCTPGRCAHLPITTAGRRCEMSPPAVISGRSPICCWLRKASLSMLPNLSLGLRRCMPR